MASSGIRVGAWDYLRWSQIRPIEKNGEVIAAKMIVYAGEDDEYFTFISPSAWAELSTWMKYRKTSGEIINGDSYVMRNLWDTRVAQGRGLATVPKQLTSLGVKRLMERAISAQGLRNKLEPGKKRHPFQANHSLRKWFKTRCEIAGMKPINVEKCDKSFAPYSNRLAYNFKCFEYHLYSERYQSGIGDNKLNKCNQRHNNEYDKYSKASS